jgi:endonuclease/exonuclease/phosphatase family metal-dependent hydrolase
MINQAYHGLLTKMSILFLVLVIFIINSCEPLAKSFDNIEDAKYLNAAVIKEPADTFQTVKVMTWNIRFGARRLPWFGDACGGRVVLTEAEVYEGMTGIVNAINEIKPDILFLQEADVKSKRTDYIDELKWIIDHTYFNYAVYVSEWRSQYIPSDGLERLDMGNAILSRWEITDAQRIQLDLRGDQDALTKYFYLRSCILKGKINIPGVPDLYLLNAHTSAFATDSTKRNHIARFKQELDNVNAAGGSFIAGGDLNTLPPGSDSTDFCEEDMCHGESFHHTGDTPMHKDGSDYTPEKYWLKGVYNDYQCAIPLAKFLANQSMYFTHTTRPGHFWDRTLDYLFTNKSWRSNSGKAEQSYLLESDHAPVTARFILPKTAIKAK